MFADAICVSNQLVAQHAGTSVRRGLLDSVGSQIISPEHFNRLVAGKNRAAAVIKESIGIPPHL